MAGKRRLIAGVLACGMCIATVILRLIALWSGHWLRASVENSTISMSLSDCENCSDEKQHCSWSCFQAYYCGLEAENPYCELFSAGATASFSVNAN
jgi:hypothetical protein